MDADYTLIQDDVVVLRIGTSCFNNVTPIGGCTGVQCVGHGESDVIVVKRPCAE